MVVIDARFDNNLPSVVNKCRCATTCLYMCCSMCLARLNVMQGLLKASLKSKLCSDLWSVCCSYNALTR